MEQVELADWTALYAALLSTLLALVGLFGWILHGPRLSVTVLNPFETTLGQSGGAFLAIVSNTGSIAVVVQRLEVSFRTSRWFWGKEIGKATFDESSRWKPSVKLVPVENKLGMTREEPNILHPHDEIRAHAKPIKDYNIYSHWIRVAAIPRNSRRRFVGWAAPAEVHSLAGVQ